MNPITLPKVIFQKSFFTYFAGISYFARQGQISYFSVLFSKKKNLSVKLRNQNKNKKTSNRNFQKIQCQVTQVWIELI
jgi:hypothetical protein